MTVTETKSETGVRDTIEALIQAGTTSDTTGLDKIYHTGMQILMLDESGDLTRFDKPDFMTMLAETVSGSRPEDHQWARFDAVDADDQRGHVLITRKVPLGGERKILTLSIDLVFEDQRWQVIREVIFIKADDGADQHSSVNN